MNREGESGGQHESWVTGKVLLTALTLVLFLDLHCFYLTLCFANECCYFHWQETIDSENSINFFLSPIGCTDLLWHDSFICLHELMIKNNNNLSSTYKELPWWIQYESANFCKSRCSSLLTIWWINALFAVYITDVS